MTRPGRLFLVVCSLVVATMSPAAVRAASSIDVRIDGIFVDPNGVSGPVGGIFAVEQFASQGGVLALGTASYSLCVPGVDSKNCLASLSQSIEVPVDAIEASCDHVSVSLAAIELVSPPSLAGFSIHFDGSVLDLVPDSRRTEQIACGIAREWDRAGRDAVLARQLDRLLRALTL